MTNIAYLQLVRFAEKTFSGQLRKWGMSAEEIVHEMYLRAARRSAGWETQSHFQKSTPPVKCTRSKRRAPAPC